MGCRDAKAGMISQALKGMQDISIKSVFDFDRTQCTEAARLIRQSPDQLPEEASDMESILKDREIDAIFIFLPEHWRALAAVRACEAGKDVYIGAGLPAHTVWEGTQVLRAARKYKRLIQCGFTLRSSESVSAAKEYITSGQLGKVVQINVLSLDKNMPENSGTDQAKPEGLDWDGWIGPAPYETYNRGLYQREVVNSGEGFWNFNSGRMAKASYGFDLARMVMGDPPDPVSVCSYASNPSQGVKGELPERQCVIFDFGDFVMNCETGQTYKYMKEGPVSMENGIAPWILLANRIEVYGQKGLMYMDTETGGWQVLNNEGKVVQQGMGDFPEEKHIRNFTGWIRSRDLTAGNIEQGLCSGNLAHLANIAYLAGNKQILFDAGKGEITNDREANSMLKTNYRSEYRMPEKL